MSATHLGSSGISGIRGGVHLLLIKPCDCVRKSKTRKMPPNILKKKTPLNLSPKLALLSQLRQLREAPQENRNLFSLGNTLFFLFSSSVCTWVLSCFHSQLEGTTSPWNLSVLAAWNSTRTGDNEHIPYLMVINREHSTSCFLTSGISVCKSITISAQPESSRISPAFKRSVLVWVWSVLSMFLCLGGHPGDPQHQYFASLGCCCWMSVLTNANRAWAIPCVVLRMKKTWIRQGEFKIYTLMYMINGITAQFGAYVDFVFQEFALQLTAQIPAAWISSARPQYSS